MSFTKSITALLMTGAFLSAAVQASPILPRDNMCNTKPTATSGSAEPISSTTVANAAACQAACEASGTCKSFVFGLPEGETVPRCLLYAVAAAEVPQQDDDNLVVFDEGCTDVPSGTPTTSDPVGDGSSNETTSSSNSNGNAGNSNGNENASQTQPQQKQKRANVCGASPSGPSTSNPTPMRTDTSVTSEEACLELCETTTGCKSVEFGRPAPSEPLECLLFSVSASSLPSLGSSETYVAYDVGC